MHSFIVGISGSGKSNLAKRFALDLVNKQSQVIIYDPLKSTGWPEGAQKYEDAGQFLELMERVQNAYIFVDESKTLWDYDEKEADKLLYKRRHQGLLTFLVAQRAYMVKPNARNQCSRIFAFRQNNKDIEILKNDYHDALAAVSTLKPGEFIASNGYVISSHKLDYSDGLPPKIINI